MPRQMIGLRVAICVMDFFYLWTSNCGHDSCVPSSLRIREQFGRFVHAGATLLRESSNFSANDPSIPAP